MEIEKFKEVVRTAINKNITYEGVNRGRLINPTPLLDSYELEYCDIRPKDISVYTTDDNCIQVIYTSQGCDDFRAMASMLKKALREVDKEYKIILKVGSRDISRSDFHTYNINKK